MERAGIDTITDGEMRRESYSNRFATALDGIDAEHPATIATRSGDRVVPRIVGPVRWRGPVEVRDVEFLRAHTDRTIKITLPGPFTMAQQASNEAYDDFDELVMDFAAAVNQEARALQAAGADVIQLDEPWLRNDPEGARRIAVRAIDAAFDGLSATTAVHMCFGYAAVVGAKDRNRYEFLGELADCSAHQISVEAAQPKLDLGQLSDLSAKTVLVGVIDLGDPEAETAEVVAAAHPRRAGPRARRAARAGARLRDEVPPAVPGLRQAAGAERRVAALVNGGSSRAAPRPARSRPLGAPRTPGLATLWKRFANAPMTAFWCVANRGSRTTSKQRRSTTVRRHKPKAVAEDS